MIKRLLFSCILISVFSFSQAINEKELTGQQASDFLNGASWVRLKEGMRFPSFVKFQEWARPDFQGFVRDFRRMFKLPDQIDFQLIDTFSDETGMTHYRFLETWDGHSVEGAMVIVHTLANQVVSMNGEAFVPSASNQQNLSEAAALPFALHYFGNSVFKWQLPGEEEFIKWETNDPSATFYPKGELVFMAEAGNYFEGIQKLCWKFDVYAHEPMERKYVFVDANDGHIVHTLERIHNADVVGSAVTRYSGTQSFTTDGFGGSFRLRETGRGNGIQTFNLQRGSNYGGAIDFTDSDNIWNNVNANEDEVATDAHWGAEKTYDYYLGRHNRNSINNAGFQLKSYVHYNTNYDNAFWDGSRMTYGDGNSFTPLTALDICGHEVTHGLTTFTANLDYSYQSGALNESFSDIFGNSVENYARPSQWSWKIGEDITTNGNGLRNMQSPNGYGDPDTYLGTNWYTGSGDNGGVHTNSGVQNKWFYILTIGESGTNDVGGVYNVTGIGWIKSGAIAFRNLTVYLTPTSNYADARFYSIQSAIDLYGACTSEVIATTNAWFAVGVGPIFSYNVDANFTGTPLVNCSVPVSVNFTNTSLNAGTFLWNFGDGFTSTAVSPSHTYNSFGNFTVTLTASGGPCGTDTLVRTNYVSISPTNGCNITMNPGTTQTQYACSGQLYDTGGSSGNYANLISSVVTISPTNASAVTLTFSSFGFENGYDFLYVFDGPTTSSPLIGAFTGNTLPNGGTVTSTGGAITLWQSTDPGVVDIGFALSWNCTYATTAPTANFISNFSSSCNGTFLFTDQSTGGPTSWNWQFGDGFTSTQQNPTHTYSTNGTYTVTLTATNSFGNNTVVRTSYVTVNRPAGPTATGASRCGPGSLTLTASGSGTIRWYDAAVGGNLVGTGSTFNTGPINSSTLYYVENSSTASTSNVGPTTFTDGSNLNNPDQFEQFHVYSQCTLVSVKVSAQGGGNRTIEMRQPNFTVINTQTTNVPAGVSTVNLNWVLQPGFNYQLGLASGTNANLYRKNSNINYPYILPGLTSIVNSNAGTGFYYYFFDWVVRGADCNSLRTPVAATINPFPVATITPPGPNVVGCPSSSVILTGGGGSTYQWSNAATTGSISVTNPGSYYVIATNGNGCRDTSDIVNVSFSSVPAATVLASGTTSFCQGDSVSLTAQPSGTSYLWSNGATTSVINASTTGNYSVSITYTGGCSSISAVTAVTVNPLPVMTVSASGPLTFCSGNSVTLTAAPPGLTYLWSNGATAQSINVTMGGIYSVRGTNSFGCFAESAPQVVTVNSANASVSPTGPLSFCQGDSVVLTAQPPSSVYSWSNGGSFQTNTINSAGSFTVTVTANGCTQTTSPVLVTVNPLPTVVLNLAGNDSLCAGDSVQISAAPAAQTYLWSNNANTPSIFVSGQGNYFVQATDANGCIGISPTQTIDVVSTSVSVTPPGPHSICAGDVVVLTSTPANSYSWSNGPSTSSISVSQSGNYSVTGSFDAGCSGNSNIVVVNVFQVPAAAFSFSPNLLTVTFTDQSTNATQWNWDFGDGGNSILQNPSHTYTNSGQYTVTLIITNGPCSDTLIQTFNLSSVSRPGDLGSTQIEIYPNPFQDQVNLRLYSIVPDKMEATLVDVLGRELRHFGPWNIEPGKEQKVILSLSEFSKATYFMHVKSAEKISVFKVIKN